MKINASLRDAVRENYQKISGSTVFCVLYNEKMINQVIPIVQMGLAVYLDKPIVLLVPKGVHVAANLRAMATAIAEFDPADPASLDVAIQALNASGHM